MPINPGQQVLLDEICVVVYAPATLSAADAEIEGERIRKALRSAIDRYRPIAPDLVIELGGTAPP